MIMGYMGDTFFCAGKKPISPGHLGDATFLPGQKSHIITFGALGGLAFDSTYNIKQANLSERKRKMYDKEIMIWQFSYHTPFITYSLLYLA